MGGARHGAERGPAASPGCTVRSPLRSTHRSPSIPHPAPLPSPLQVHGLTPPLPECARRRDALSAARRGHRSPLLPASREPSHPHRHVSARPGPARRGSAPQRSIRARRPAPAAALSGGAGGGRRGGHARRRRRRRGRGGLCSGAPAPQRRRGSCAPAEAARPMRGSVRLRSARRGAVHRGSARLGAAGLGARASLRAPAGRGRGAAARGSCAGRRRGRSAAPPRRGRAGVDPARHPHSDPLATPCPLGTAGQCRDPAGDRPVPPRDAPAAAPPLESSFARTPRAAARRRPRGAEPPLRRWALALPMWALAQRLHAPGPRCGHSEPRCPVQPVPAPRAAGECGFGPCFAGRARGPPQFGSPERGAPARCPVERARLFLQRAPPAGRAGILLPERASRSRANPGRVSIPICTAGPQVQCRASGSADPPPPPRAPAPPNSLRLEVPFVLRARPKTAEHKGERAERGAGYFGRCFIRA